MKINWLYWFIRLWTAVYRLWNVVSSCHIPSLQSGSLATWRYRRVISRCLVMATLGWREIMSAYNTTDTAVTKMRRK